MKSEDIAHLDSENQTHLSQLASVGQMAAGIAHEVKNPLTAVKGFLQLLQQEVSNQYIDIAYSELENALTTLNNLLQVSKPDLENEDFQRVNLTVELESILNLFQDKLYNIKLITDFKNTDVTIIGKKNQFKKAFFNLIKNAIESIESEGTLTITHKLFHDDVVVTIRDTGVGIPEDKLHLLGTPFFTTKDEGTGMGLTQVFSSIYQHGGKITVDSKEKSGTIFTIRIPINYQIKERGVRKLDLKYSEDYTIKDFFLANKETFEQRLLDEAINVKDKIEEIHRIGNINLLHNAQKVVLFVVEEKEHELISFAKQEGVVWAKYSLTLAFKLEWVQAIRRTLWDFLYNFDILTEAEVECEKFYSLEKKINELIDQFFAHFFISYSKFKDDLLEMERQKVEKLSVPIIPINSEVCIVPLIGSLDKQRVLTVQDKVLHEIEQMHIQTLIIDLSGVAQMDPGLIKHFITLIECISMMGTKTILTGLRADIVKTLISSGIGYNSNAEFKGTLQQALKNLVIKA